MTKQSLVEVLAPDRTKSELERMFDDYLACMRVAVADRWKTEGGLHVDLQRRGSDVSLLLVSLRFQSCNSFSVEKRLRLPTLLRKLSNAWAAQLFIKIGRLKLCIPCSLLGHPWKLLENELLVHICVFKYCTSSAQDMYNLRTKLFLAVLFTCG